MYKHKYLKYKSKYIHLSIMNGGFTITDDDFIREEPINLNQSSDDQIKNLGPGVVSAYNLSALKYIIKKGYDINKTNVNGLSILHYYAQKKPSTATLNAVKYLIKEGANRHIISNNGYTAIDVAKIYNKPIFNYLSKL